MTQAVRRIALIECNEDGTVGGSHRALVDLAMRLDRRRYEPVVVFYEEQRHVTELRRAGVEVHVLAEMRSRERAIRLRRGRAARLSDAVRAVWRRARLLRSWRVDVVHLNNAPSVGFDDWLPAAGLLRLPCITWAMGADTYDRWHQRLGLRHFDVIVAISRYVADTLHESGARDGQVLHIPLGIDAAAERARRTVAREAMRAALGVAPTDVLAVMVGNVRPWKGQHVVLEALANLDPSALGRLVVLFAGASTARDRPYQERLESRVAELGLAGRVRFLGSRTDTADLFGAADIALHASVDPEPFGLVILEAMAHGCPVLATAAGGPLEIVTEDSGALWPPGDPLALAAHLTRWMSEPELRQRLAAGAQQRVEAFPWAGTVHAIEAVYARLRP